MEGRATVTRKRPRPYDVTVHSEGLTIDTPRGPVDLVAVRRARAGVRTALTPAERAYLVSTLPAYNRGAVELAAVGMGVQLPALLRAMTRSHAAARTAAAGALELAA